MGCSLFEAGFTRKPSTTWQTITCDASAKTCHAKCTVFIRSEQEDVNYKNIEGLRAAK